MPSFCRHGRLLQNCTICSDREGPVRSTRAVRTPRTRSAPPRAKASTGMRVRRVQRAPDDGYDHELAPGLRSSVDAARLADELAFSEARLAELGSNPPGLYAEAASGADPEESLWLAFLIAYICPLRGPDAFAGIEAARVPWASGELPILDDIPLGPRTAHDPARGTATLAAYRGWAERGGSQRAALMGEPEWEPERRFARTFERLMLPGLHRGARFELLVSIGALGLIPLHAGALWVRSEATDPVVVAAKRVFGIGDPPNLERRARELAAGTGVPLAALDLALFNWSVAEEERATMGARTTAAPERRAAIAGALGVA